MNEENESSMTPPIGFLVLYVAIICIVTALLYWVGELYPAMYIWMLVGFVAFALLWSLAVVLEFASIVLGAILKLFRD